MGIMADGGLDEGTRWQETAIMGLSANIGWTEDGDEI
jgi:hypothetical protein